jgi:hypothetical protein
VPGGQIDGHTAHLSLGNVFLFKVFIFRCIKLALADSRCAKNVKIHTAFC